MANFRQQLSVPKLSDIQESLDDFDAFILNQPTKLPGISFNANQQITSATRLPTNAGQSSQRIFSSEDL